MKRMTSCAERLVSATALLITAQLLKTNISLTIFPFPIQNLCSSLAKLTKEEDDFLNDFYDILAKERKEYADRANLGSASGERLVSATALLITVQLLKTNISLTIFPLPIQNLCSSLAKSS
jgi:hypothetical protein